MEECKDPRELKAPGPFPEASSSHLQDSMRSFDLEKGSVPHQSGCQTRVKEVDQAVQRERSDNSSSSSGLNQQSSITIRQSDHQSSELNLGFITRIPDPSGRKDYRGEGFELRTDGHGVIRSDQGLVLTTHGKQNADSYIKDIAESTTQLNNAVEQHKLQTEVAINQKADERSIDATAQTELNRKSIEYREL